MTVIGDHWKDTGLAEALVTLYHLTEPVSFLLTKKTQIQNTYCYAICIIYSPNQLIFFPVPCLNLKKIMNLFKFWSIH